jgi:FAD/FMN-containing dehydrogenase
VPDTTATDLSSLRHNLDGAAFLPGDAGWDDARRAWNLSVDQEPAAVIQAAGAADVVRVVDFARERGLRVAPQSTGHGAGCMAPLTDTILLRTGQIDSLEVDASERRARVESGVLAADVALAAGEAGLAALLGSSPDTGVTGFTLGGGVGWLGRRYGLACNSVRAVEIVTADGQQRRVDSDNDPDLFFALRGGGGGSFGVVTALEIELYPVAEVYAGMVAWPGEMGSEIAHAYRQWLPGAPDEITAQLRFMTLPPLPDLPEPLRGKSLVDVTGAFIGDPAAGEELMRPLREIEGAVWDTWGVQPAPALRRLGMDPEEPVPGVGDSVTLGQLTPAAVDAVVALSGAGADSPLMGVQVRQLGGALGRDAKNAGALPKLGAEHIVFGVGAIFDPAARPPIESYLDKIQEELAPYSAGRRVLNFSDRPGDVAAGFPPAVWERLLATRARYDPAGMFVASQQVG